MAMSFAKNLLCKICNIAKKTKMDFMAKAKVSEQSVIIYTFQKKEFCAIDNK